MAYLVSLSRWCRACRFPKRAMRRSRGALSALGAAAHTYVTVRGFSDDSEYRILRRDSRLTHLLTEKEKNRLHLLGELERAFYSSSREDAFRLAGVDEAGRGSLAGPVVAAACVLPRDLWIENLNDSKKLSPFARDEIYDLLLDPRTGVDVGVGIVEADVIDAVNILEATVIAMQKALQALRNGSPAVALIDGSLPATLKRENERNAHNASATEFFGIVNGDASSLSIAAASIVAKVTRDRLMENLDKHYPGYEFADNKGYPTPRHLELLRELGPSPIHRRSFAPVKQFFHPMGMNQE
ncbi:probable ribonuclease H [Cyanidioschyzon merolae strain 10D]|jgi:ribonuclease HII|uniref:Ribonuclease n=1 Tax=Cyanidioschyzon merolae (strain NIES-3377 / 10D) TaxID=280699 RepID=M1UY40_CYAM1|nr:probable ribonuclease H [Cyanidioschyzon merolae strain 10D]BAM83521.1 probable ribonuclease H [Cyanidioschyzon merolae strain 10D]|eukprot:XP_005539557.1 probable ribonuclease H [Cyanidioschyzon merolae strain 10D]